MSYQPSIEDVAQLAMDQPERFSSPVTTLRSIQSALQYGDDAVGQAIHDQTLQTHYNDYLNNGGQPLTESPIPPGPVLEGPAHDTEFGGVCVDCASLTPCIKKVEVVCHGGENHRVTLQGQKELENTDGKIYFVADKFVTGEATLEAFLHDSGQVKDTGQVSITLAEDCSHQQHTLYWTDELDGTPLRPGQTTTVDFTVMTQPVVPISLPTPLLRLPRDAQMAFRLAGMLLDVLMRRSHMVNEQYFRITYDGTNDFCFTTVTLPMLKLDGHITIKPPSLGERFVQKSEGREVAAERGMGSRVRKITTRQDWGVSAGITAVCGTTTSSLTFGSTPETQTTYDSGPSLRRAANQHQQKSAVERFFSALTDASKKLSHNLTASGGDDDKLLSFFTDGPQLQVGVTSELAEENGKPGLTATITPGLTLSYECGVRIDIYAALKRAIRLNPAGRALVVFLEELEEGVDTWVAEGGLKAELYIEVSLRVGEELTEDGLGNHMLNATYNVQEDAFESYDGQVAIILKAMVGGGLLGHFDSIVTEEYVFNYQVQAKTSGSIIIGIEDDQWGYRWAHSGAVVKVQGYKKADVTERDSQPGAGGDDSGRTQRRRSQVTTTMNGSEWVKDGAAHSYRLADAWEGEFHAFT